MCGRHARAIKNDPFALMLTMRSNLLVGVSTMFCHHRADALLMRMSTRPNLATVASTQSDI